MRKLREIISETYKLTLHVNQKCEIKGFALYVSGRFAEPQEVSKAWVIENKIKFKKRFHAIIDQISQNLHPVYEPKACEIDYDHQEITCLNYKAEKVKLKLSKHNASKLGLNVDLIC